MVRSWLVLVPVVAIVAVASCGGEEIGERALERQLESELGGDADVELDDEGNFSIRTEEGEFNVETDDEGNVSISGSGDDGDVSMRTEDGQTIIESDEGTAISGQDLPKDFPDQVPLPDDMTVQFGTQVESPDGLIFTLGGTVPGSPSDVVDAYTAKMDDAGFTQTSITTTSDGSFFVYESAEYVVAGNFFLDAAEPGATVFQLSVTPPPTT